MHRWLGLALLLTHYIVKQGHPHPASMGGASTSATAYPSV